mmetsp:Transcript_5349/g.9239  ORF Transcript_5349/g.9239 Transcript_5349/m.9239 type:complete len:87 (-) Transcript_5349:382-642(-)
MACPGTHWHVSRPVLQLQLSITSPQLSITIPQLSSTVPQPCPCFVEDSTGMSRDTLTRVPLHVSAQATPSSFSAMHSSSLSLLYRT